MFMAYTLSILFPFLPISVHAVGQEKNRSNLMYPALQVVYILANDIKVSTISKTVNKLIKNTNESA
jgi:hypothetical protein